MAYINNNIEDFLQLDNKRIPEIWNAFLEDLFIRIDKNIEKSGRILILTLTKKSSEEITNFLISKWYKTYYLHSEIDTMDRWEIINKLKTWEIDILVWVNLLREWIDLPEVTLLAILDADKEWFLRSTTSLIQIIWRAARNPDSEVVLYWDNFTESIVKALRETYRRRYIQNNYNLKNKIKPKKAISNIKSLNVVKTDDDIKLMSNISNKWKVKKLKKATKKEKEIIIKDLRAQLEESIKSWEFEKASIIRDQLKELQD